MAYVPIATAHPSLTNAAWTKVNTVPGKDRLFFMAVNESGVDIRVETSAVAPTLATDGFKVADGQVYQEAGVTASTQDVYIYQSSGGAITTVSIKEGT